VPVACITGISSRATNGKGDEHRRQHNAGHGEDDLEIVRVEPFAEEALQPEQHHEHQAGDDRRNRKRQINQRDEEDLPRNWNLAIAHAAASPKRTFSGTLMAATSSVSRIAARESGLHQRLPVIAPALRKACAKTLTSGSSRNTKQNAIATVMSVHLDDRRFLRAAFGFGAAGDAGFGAFRPCQMLKPAGPLFEQVDGPEQQERNHQQHHRQRDRPGVSYSSSRMTMR
jgi:hypothetical protein